MKANAAKNIFLFLLAFLGVGALFGGGVLIIFPSGKLFEMPLNLLQNSPFHDFLFPGIILFTVLGLAPCFLVFALLTKPKSAFAEFFNFFKDFYWAWSYSIYVAFALIIWIQVEMAYIQSVHWSHTLYMFWAIAIIFVALLPQIRNLYKNSI
jgi:hypothetical protein